MWLTIFRVSRPYRFLLLVVGALAVARTLPAAGICAPGHILVCFKPVARELLVADSIEGQLTVLNARLGLPAGARLSETPLTQINRARRGANGRAARPHLDLDRFLYLRLPPDLTVAECIRRLQHHPLIDYAEPDWIGTGAETIPNDPGFADQWHHRNVSNPSASIRTPPAWDITRGSSNVLVAVLDTGLAELPEFMGRTVPGYNFAYTNEVTLDDHGHGTQVAGLLAASANNGVLVAGVDWHCRIMPLKVFDSRNMGFYSWWAQAIDYAVSNGCKVINLSGGGAEFSRAVQRSITNAIARGVIFVTAAGNNAATNLSFPGYLREPITVGATDAQDQRAHLSNSGPQLDLVAPGMDVVTVGLTGEPSLAQGTSFAAPLVSGVCALLAALHPNLTQADARLLLCAGADDEVGGPADTPGFDTCHGWGRLNALNSLLLATTRVDKIRHADGVTELSWRGPANAAGKRPFQVERKSSFTEAWLPSTGADAFRFGADRIWWSEDRNQSVETDATGFYRVGLRPLP